MTDTPLRRAQDALRIHDVYLVGSRLWMAEDFLPHMHVETLSVQSKHGVRETLQLMDVSGTENDGDVQYRIVRFMLDTGFRFVSQDESNGSAASDGSAPSDDARSETGIRAEIKATFAAEYQILRSEIEGDEEALKEFKDSNALYHVWPYWRELVQSTLARSRMPQVMLPMFRLPAKNGKKDKASD